MPEILGLIAGDGGLPFELARAARAAGLSVAAVAHRGATDRRLAREVASLDWVHVGQLARTADALRTRGARRALFAGGLAKGLALLRARPDAEARKLWGALPERGDDRLLRAIAEWFAGAGITIADPTSLLHGCFAPEGQIAGPQAAPELLAEARRGFALAKQLGELDIGQTVVVRDGMVLAVEAMEGTDACIARAGRVLPGGVVVKVLKPGQDRRFDLPAVGRRTLDVLAKAKASLLAVEAGVTLLIDREALVADARIPIVGLR